ncbi:hypothetical protein GN277_16050 [Lachnospiraceae bacterium WCA-9-b2]|jgi:transcriptional antiterminator NusG|uniref:NusG-like N-terminal domain-containing protein n=1 Tax=Sporofaciens musculi TaxID=2681861 RepID=A0A7X3SJR8_9FIRM|nr:transcription termination/antitermination NusG family protein [Sporofaciens musculi]MXP76843.1 hypothetical protein [Sporofaciens musculi]
MWYVIQTQTGGEEKLVELIEKMIPKEHYDECFCMNRECVRKMEKGYEIFLRPLFPAYIFVVTENPEKLFFELKRVPKLTKLLSDQEDTFFSVSEDEETFLKNVQNENHVVQRSLVEVDDKGTIIKANGAVGVYMNRIVRQRLRKRYVCVEQEFMGEKRKIYLGIKLEEEDV